MDKPLTHGIDADNLAALPRAAGVYIFRGEGTLPLYIGKSIDIRARVLSHLRTPEEANMLAQTRRVDVIETAGEIGALLLEAHMIKAHHPLFNVRLRRLKHTHTLRLLHNEGLSPVIVSSKDTDIGQHDGLYGLFSSPRAAQEKLRELAKEHVLCHALLGLEKPSARGCFGLQIKTCRGACVGQEERSAHDQRLLAALQDMQVHAWPYPGAIDVVECAEGWTQKHRIHNWRYLGTWCSRAQGNAHVNLDGNALTLQGPAEHTPHSTRAAHTAPAAFDLDTYKILVKPLLLGTAQVQAA